MAAGGWTGTIFEVDVEEPGIKVVQRSFGKLYMHNLSISNHPKPATMNMFKLFTSKHSLRCKAASGANEIF